MEIDDSKNDPSSISSGVWFLEGKVSGDEYDIAEYIYVWSV